MEFRENFHLKKELSSGGAGEISGTTRCEHTADALV
jgi:hypothetical protein